MQVYGPENIKNVAVVGHSGHGKTTLVEGMLFHSGATERIGKVEDGNTVTDFDPEEIKRKISISAAVAPVEWKGYKINLIDAPGFFDFEAEAVQAYYLADSALILANAASGIGVGSEKAYKYCKQHGKPMAFLINQIDKENADFEKVAQELKDKYGNSINVMQLPIMEGDKFKGIVDVLDMQAYEFANGLTKIDIPADLAERAQQMRDEIIENAAANDEELMAKFFEAEELSRDDILRGFKLGVSQGDIIPVFVASAALNLGVRLLLDSILEYLPSAVEAAPIQAKVLKTGEDIELNCDNNKEFVARVCKTIADPFVGKLSIIKILQGQLKSDTALYNATKEKGEKSGAFGLVFGKKTISVPTLNAGDIGAIAKLQNTSTGDTLCAASKPCVLPAMEFDEPCISLAVTAKKKGDEEKIFAGLHKLEEEDPAFTITKQPETGETLANGMGETHLDVICQKLKNKFGAEAVLVDPKIPYRETIRKAAEAEGKHKKQSGGAGQFGVVNIRFEPTDSEFEFVNAIVGGVVPKEYIPAVEKGLKESMVHGVLAGYPMVNVKATLFDGKYHPVDSKEVAFKSAARLSYKAACAAANPVLLEPIVKAEILVPDEYMGDIMGDLNRRRGRILGMNPGEDGMQKLEAEVPMSEMFKYATDLRSMTRGTGSFKMEVIRYEEVPAQISAKIIEQAQKEAEE